MIAPQGGPGTPPPQRWRLVLPAAAAFGLVATASAWLCDDAFITLRTIDNFVNGLGLRWNMAERVQAFTHPLWLLALSAAYAVTREPYYGTIAVSVMASTICVALVCRCAASPAAAVAVVTLLAASKAFVDYSTSGLENPLSHLALALFFTEYWRDDGMPRPRRLVLLFSFCALTRLDLALIALPAVLRAAARRGRQVAPALAAGLIPLLAWLLFALVYYGSPVPNTAPAKLGTGIEPSWLIGQGLYYLVDSVTLDHVTLPAVVLGWLVPVASRGDWASRLGIVLYLAYVIRIGGDFMSGRFLTPLLLVSAMRMSRWVGGRASTWAWAAIPAVLVVALLSPHPPFLGNHVYDPREAITNASRSRGINDERRFYWQRLGLFSPNRAWAEPRWDEHGAAARQEGAEVTRRRNVGLYGFHAGPTVHVVDPYALADPLLARLPPLTSWRVGHYQRLLPHGYLETLSSRQNVLVDEGVRRYYDHLVALTRQPLFAPGRLRTIAWFNLGAYDSLLDEYRRRLAAGEDVGVQ